MVIWSWFAEEIVIVAVRSCVNTKSMSHRTQTTVSAPGTFILVWGKRRTIPVVVAIPNHNCVIWNTYSIYIPNKKLKERICSTFIKNYNSQIVFKKPQKTSLFSKKKKKTLLNAWENYSFISLLFLNFIHSIY